MTRVALFTSQDIGYELVDYFRQRQDVELLTIAYEKPHDRALGYRSALAFCRERGLPHLDAPKADERVADALGSFRPDIIISAYYAKVLPSELLSKARLGGINVHPGKLPYYKGRYPTPWYILNGEATFGIALHQMVEEVDAGSVYVQREFEIPPSMTGYELLRQTMRRGAAVICESFDAIVSGAIVPQPQGPGGSRYDHIEREHQIDWNQPAEMISRHIRVHARPYTPAYSFCSGHRVFINNARPIAVPGPPGSVIHRYREGPIVVGCGIGSLRVFEYDTDTRIQLGYKFERRGI
jgi:methionyl-tRNA formyltransferase